MRFHDTNKLTVCLFLSMLLFSCGSILGVPGHKTGTLVGSMLFVDQGETVSLGDAANVTVELEHKDQVVLLVSNDHGDYVRELPEGTYCLKSARGAEGKPLRFSLRQYKCFKIRSKKDTRFDVMLLKP
jgi:hypothetical protein